MNNVTISIPEPLYKAAEELIRAETLMAPETGASEDEQETEIQRKMSVLFERAIFNFMEELVGVYFRDFDCPEHKQYEKVFRYLREYLDEYFKHIETIRKAFYEKYRKEKNERTAD